MLNKLKKFNVFLVVLLIFSISLSGCSRSQNQQRTSNISKQNGQTVTVTDLVGRRVKIKLPVNKVVGIGPGALRLITYIDGVNRVSGVENIDKKLTDGRTYNMVFYNELDKLPVIGQGGPDSVPDAENLVQANPDVIFVASLLDKSKADELQAKTGIPVVVLSYGKLGTFDEDVYTSLNVIGKIMGKEDRAEKLVSQIKKIQEDLSYRTKEIPD
ncbi:MAG: iron complex transport system substrate-binding protein, partial [Thermoanaerobacterium sp.]|nr:iron complex transport system substrate-binding protein [Thermoanaerobacterium sp.]